MARQKSKTVTNKRTKSGRLAENSVVVQAVIDVESAIEIDRLAKKLHMSRSAFLAQLIEFGLKDNRAIIEITTILQEFVKGSKAASL